LVQLRRITPQLDELGYRLIGISPDKPERLRETGTKYKLHYRLLSDKTMNAARSFGIAFQIVDKPPEYYQKLERASGEQHYQLPVPAIFIVGTDHTIKFEHIDPNFKARLDPDVILTAAKAMLGK
jgi:peroxiredoxin